MQKFIYLIFIFSFLSFVITDIPFPWKITVCGKTFENIHLNEDYVRNVCNSGEVCVPLNHNLKYCNKIDNLTKDKQIQKMLREKNCGYVHGVPMLCFSVNEVNPDPECFIGHDFCNIPVIRATPSSNGDIGCGSRLHTSDEPRISGGEAAHPGKYPWMAAMLNRSNKKWRCGGSLISDRHVLTAAHCVFGIDIDDIEVRLGETDLNTKFDCFDVEDCTDSRECFNEGKCAEPHQSRRIKEIRINPNYKNEAEKLEERTNDLAVIELDRRVFRTKTVIPVCLPSPSQIKNLRDPSPNNLFFVAGYGKTSNTAIADVLQEAQVSIVPQNDCGLKWSFKVDASFLCVGRFGGGGAPCMGDSGGPLVTVSPAGMFIQIGVVSAGDQFGCGPQGKPTLFTILNEERLTWVQRMIDKK